MAGYKQWADGDILTPTDLDEYLVGQTLMRFATAAARTAALPSPVAGMRSYQVDTGLEYIYANGQWAPLFQWKKKAAAENVTSSAALQDDDHLQVTLVPGAYRIEAFLHASGGTAGDILVAWAFAGTTASSARACFGPTRTTTDVGGGTTGSPVTAAVTVGVNRSSGHLIGTSVPYGIDGGLASAIHEDLFLDVTTGGLLKLQWAQETSSATSTTLSTASRIYVSRLS